MRAGVGFDAGLDPEAASTAACEEALAQLPGPPDLLLLFATAAWGQDVRRVVARGRELAAGATFAGATTLGLFGREQSAEQRPAVGCLAAVGLVADSFWVEPDLRDPEGIAEDLERQMAPLPQAGDWLLVLHGTRSVPVAAALAGVGRLAPGCPVAGIAASPVPRGRTCLWADDEIGLAGLAGLVVRAPARVSLSVTWPRLALGGPHHSVSRSNGPWVLELDGERALDVFRARAGATLGADLRRASRYLAVQLGPEPDPARLHSIVGFDVESGAFSLPVAVEPGSRLGFSARDGGDGRRDLERMLARAPTAAARAGLYLGCRARGSALFGDPDLEPALVRRAVEAPLLGVQGNLQLTGGASLTHSAVLALLS